MSEYCSFLTLVHTYILVLTVHGTLRKIMYHFYEGDCFFLLARNPNPPQQDQRLMDSFWQD